MILSVSRRTDIPAFYHEWFFNRVQAGYVLVRNPLNYHQVSRVVISPSVTDCIVFWTKNPAPMLDKLDLLSEYKYYFQVTITPYSGRVEKHVPPKQEVVKSFQRLSQTIGKEKTIWRYDPIVLTEELDIKYHCESFERLAAKLRDYTTKCIISFFDSYRKTKGNLPNHQISAEQMYELGQRLAEIAGRHDLRLETCAEKLDLSGLGIEHGSCIDRRLISKLVGADLTIGKDKNQRDTCGCVESVDIGAYNTCHHGCTYCYANYSEPSVKTNTAAHDPSSPLLIGSPTPEDKITERKLKTCLDKQLHLFQSK